LIGEALTAMATTKETWQESDLYRIAGDLALMSPEPDAAMAQVHYDRALPLAREQKAKSWELRAAMSVARLWSDRGRRREALDLLVPIRGWFSDGFATPDLKEADTLLAEMASQN
jgi:predicted ATPase